MFLFARCIDGERFASARSLSRLSDSLLLEGTEDRECVVQTVSSNCHDRFVPKVLACSKPSATAAELRPDNKVLSEYQVHRYQDLLLIY